MRYATVALAISWVGWCVFTAYALALSADLGPAPGDRELRDLADGLRAGGLVAVIKAGTALGSLPVVALLVVGAGVLLLVRGHLPELVALVAGSLLVYVTVRLAKEGIERRRPPGPLASAGGFAYPSGHAAYSTIWVATALAVARAAPGFAWRAALVPGAVAIAVAVGLSRVYLRVHFWSDVAGGWGVGAGILGACAAGALTVSHIRQNGRGQASAGRT